MVTLGITYQGKLRCDLVHEPSGARLLSDAPVDNQGLGESFSPTDLLAGALGTCMATVMGIVAQRDGIPLEGMQVRVEKHMSATPFRRVSRLVVTFTMPAGITAEQRAKLEKAAHTCPVARSLSADIEMDVSFSYPGISTAVVDPG